MALEAPDNEERDLLAEYDMATSFYSWAVSELARQRGLLPRDAFLKLFQVAEDARTDCERVRSELEEFRKRSGNLK